jgi:hypothetical protein
VSRAAGAAAPWLLALVLSALALSGCETTAEESARLERAAKHTALSAERGLTIRHASRYVKVLSTQILHSGEQTAAIVTLRNTSAHALRDAPLAITVHDAHGTALFKNDAPGLEAALTSVALLPPGAQTVWIDDQVQASGTPTGVTALVGEGHRTSSAAPRLQISDVHRIEDPASGPGAAGTVTNESAITQHSLAIYALARRGSRIVAAGRAVLPEVAAHGSGSFEIFFVGKAAGAQLQLSAQPSNL